MRPAWAFVTLLAIATASGAARAEEPVRTRARPIEATRPGTAAVATPAAATPVRATSAAPAPAGATRPAPAAAATTQPAPAAPATPSPATEAAGAAALSRKRTLLEKTADRPGMGWAMLPGAWFSTDNGLGVSATALLYFPLADDPRKPSELGFVGILTTGGDNVLRASPVLRFVDSGYQFDGRFELGQRAGTYYGMGNETLREDAESYERLKLLAEGKLSRRWGRLLYLGVAWDGYWSSRYEVLEGGALDGGGVSGTEGGAVMGLGAVVRVDTRDRVYAPSRGALVEAAAYVYDEHLGSRYAFGRLRIDARAYLPIARGGHVLAMQLRGDATSGEPPFDRLPSAGNARILRGIGSGRYRDRHFLAAQVEYRSPIWWRLGLAVFGATGRVAPSFAELARPSWKVAGGAGLRLVLRRTDHVHLRADVGLSADGYQLYLNLREAF